MWNNNDNGSILQPIRKGGEAYWSLQWQVGGRQR